MKRDSIGMYLGVHDGASEQSDAEERRTGHFEDFHPPVLVDGAHQTHRHHYPRHRNHQQNNSITKDSTFQKLNHFQQFFLINFKLCQNISIVRLYIYEQK